MPPNATPRYRPSYRENEVGLICGHAASGVSMALVGVAGVGKSNLVNFLRSEGGWRGDYLGPVADCAVFPVVDCPSWEHTPESLWKMMLAALLAATRAVPAADEGPVVPLSEADRALGRLRNRLRTICQEMQWHVMFILDDFDPLLEAGPLSMLETLYTLRNDGGRDLMSYLVLTKRLPHLLGRAHNLDNGSKFYGLFKRDVYPLRPHALEDAQQMLRHLNILHHEPLSDRELDQVGAWAGGHAHLLRVIFEVCANERPAAQDMVGFFAAHRDVRHECRRLLDGLHEEEQAVAWRLARSGPYHPDDAPIVNHLLRRGLLVQDRPAEWFSPVFARFLSSTDRSEALP